MAERQLPELKSRLRLDTADLSRAKLAVDRFKTSVSGPINTKNLDAIAAKSSKIGGQLTRNVTLPVVAIGTAAAHLALDFDTAFTKIASTTDVPAGAIAGLRDQVLDLARATGQMPKDLANALLLIERSGVGPARAMDVLTNAAKAAALGLGDVTDISNTITAAMHVYGPSVLSASKATDILVSTAKEGKAGIGDLGPQLGRLLPIAKNLHLGFDQVAGSLAVLSRGGGGASQGGALLFQVLSKLEKQTPTAAKALKSVGLSADDIRSSLEKNGLIATLQALQDKLGGTTQDLAKLFGGGRSIAGVFALMNNDGRDASAGIDKVTQSAGQAQTAFEILNKSDPQKAKQALASLEASGIQLGERLLPALTQIGSSVAGLARDFSLLPKPVQSAVVDLTILAALSGPLVKLFGLGAKGASAFLKTIDSPALDKFRLGLMGVTQEGAGASNAAGGFVASVGGFGAVMPAAAGALGILTAAFIIDASRAARAKENVDKFAAAAASNTDVIKNFNTALAATLAGSPGGFNLDISGGEFRKGFEEAGISAKKLSALLLGSQKDFDAFVKSALAKNRSAATDAFVGALIHLRGEAGKAKTQTKDLATAEAALGLGTDTATGAIDRQTSATEDLGHASEVTVDDIAKFADAAKASFDAHMAEADAVDSLTQAQSDLSDARKAARPDSDQMIQALRAERDAEKGVADAKKESQDAEKALDQARVDAAKHLIELRNAAVDTADAERNAEIDLEEARRKVQEGNFNSPVEKDRAEQAVVEAEHKLTEAQQAKGQAAKDSAEADAKGVEGSDEVVAAKQRISDAADGERAAQERLSDSTKAVTKVQTDSAKAVRDAQDKVTKAELGVVVAHAAVAQQAGNVKGANDALITGLSALARTLDPANPVRKNIDAFLAQLIHIKAAYDSISGSPAPTPQTGTAIPPTRDPDAGPRLPTKGVRLRVPTPSLAPPTSAAGSAAGTSTVIRIEPQITVIGDPDATALAKMEEVASAAVSKGLRKAAFR